MLIWILLAIILAALFLPSLVVGAWRFWFLTIQKSSIIGTDKTMLSHGDIQPVTNGFQFNVNEHWPAYYQTFKECLQTILNQSRSPLYIYHNQQKKCYSYHKTLQLSDILFEYDNTAPCKLLSMPAKRSVVVRACPKAGYINIAFDHGCFDGMRMYNEIYAPLFALKPYQPPKAFSQYTMFVNEWRIMHMIWRNKDLLAHKPIPSYQNINQQYSCLLEFDLQIIKQLKRKYKLSLSETVLIFYAMKAFQALDRSRTTFTIGLLVACDHPRFRNNYSIIPYQFTRTPHFKHLAAQLIAQRHKEKNIQPTYHLLSFATTQAFIKRNVIDALVSPFIFYGKKTFNQQINHMEFINMPTLLPLYSLFISHQNKLSISITVNSPAISIEKLQKNLIQVYDYPQMLLML